MAAQVLEVGGESPFIPSELSIEDSYLCVFDFDGTVGATFETSPLGSDVEQNYRQTLGQIFGPEILQTYEDQGGLRNRAPAEVIADLYEVHPSAIGLARAHYDENHELLESVMPLTKAQLLRWEEEPLKTATEVYIRQDLINSLEHVRKYDDGAVWPRICDGFEILWNTLQQLNDSEPGFKIDTGIISSGYVEYITNCLDLWGLPYPDIWVTDDQTRSRKYPDDITRRVKPAPFAVALAHQKWLKIHGASGRNFGVAQALKSKERMFYFGDSLTKDGQMAERSRIGFGHFNPNTSTMVHDEVISFGDWREIERKLKDNVGKLAEHVAISTIIRGEN